MQIQAHMKQNQHIYIYISEYPHLTEEKTNFQLEISLTKTILANM